MQPDFVLLLRKLVFSSQKCTPEREPCTCGVKWGSALCFIWKYCSDTISLRYHNLPSRYYGVRERDPPLCYIISPPVTTCATYRRVEGIGRNHSIATIIIIIIIIGSFNRRTEFLTSRTEAPVGEPTFPLCLCSSITCVVSDLVFEVMALENYDLLEKFRGMIRSDRWNEVYFASPLHLVLLIWPQVSLM